ncbi:hypothetical protein Dalk_2186 [Desulfatibacillum aliphaticivorans]|uniref:Uncharacterized protein n=1 Tax=Desulfatibacillum aliphaticivorans TaxID=218208 RepID=B8FF62_DESAL|nr:hypothetical protein Dalk_2186 [Desulfatibacillum aliphaticivorans]
MQIKKGLILGKEAFFENISECRAVRMAICLVQTMRTGLIRIYGVRISIKTDYPQWRGSTWL